MEPKILDDEAIKYLKSQVRPEDGVGPWMHDSGCLPANEDGLYKVLRSVGDEARWVPEKDVHRYPWIFINTVWALEDGVPMKKVTPACYKGVNPKGISLVALDVSKSAVAGKKLHKEPTIRCRYGDHQYFIYRLDKFLPGPGIASYDSLITFSRSVAALEEATGGTYIYDDPILNFECPLVESNSIFKRVFNFADLRKAGLSSVEIERKRLAGRRSQSTAAYKTNRIRIDKSKSKIIKAIHDLRASGQPVNKSSVTRAAKVGRNTVYAHWDSDEVRTARGE